ncbi:hypothetical protein T4E_809 [Trichinella pseudospiralis]|uniref:Uncharacterized protein n=1 Tax=Trichinella pseudospiralis TaxID=6337 RepID=A0A0V0Y575_TRIPS|nr:hypothetical protein T4E_809 [Trichinella pseudospiralis]
MKQVRCLINKELQRETVTAEIIAGLVVKRSGAIPRTAIDVLKRGPASFHQLGTNDAA